MIPGTLLDRLEELQGGLEGLLSCLEAERFPEGEQVDAAWRHVQRGFERVRAELDGFAGARDDVALRERVAHCLRLYAVAAGVLAQRREELAAEHAACSTARACLRRLEREDESGGSCDVRA